MTKQEASKAFKHTLFGRNLTHCKTVLQSSARIGLSALLALSMISCTPSGGGTSITNQYFTNHGTDKKLPDDGGYQGTGGTGDGGGGQGILCSADTKNPEFRSKLFVRDIFEAIYNSKFKMKTVPGPSGEGTEKVSPEAIHFLLGVLKSYFGPALPQLEIGKTKFWEEFVARISFLDDDAKLYASQDANSPIALPNGCKIAQIAYWDDSTGKAENGTLYVDKAQWMKLDSLNKIALLAHEYFFKEARRAGYKNSDFVRARIGQLFSDKGLDPVFAGIDPNVSPLKVFGYPIQSICEGRSESDPSARILLYRYLDPVKFFRVVIPYISSSTINISSLNTRSFENNHFDKEERLRYATGFFFHRNVRGALQFRENETLNSQWAYELRILTNTNWYSYVDNFNSVVTTMAAAPKTIWSGYLPSASGSLKVSIQNPLSTLEENNSTVSATDAGQKIYELLDAEIFFALTSIPKLKNSRDDEFHKQTLAAQVVLNAEVTELIKSGKYPENFPKWEEALRVLTRDVFNKYNITDVDQNLILGKKSISQVYPTLLFKFKMGNLSISQSAEISRAHSETISRAKTYVISGGKLAVTNGADNAIFDLKCESPDALYHASLSNKLLAKKIEPKQTPLAVEIDPKMRASEDTTKLMKEYATKIISQLSGRPDPTRQESILDRTDCDFMSETCRDISFLRRRMLVATQVKVGSCRDYYHRNPDFYTKPNESGYANYCITLNFPEDQSYYMVSQSASSNGELQPFLVRAITPPFYNEIPQEDF